VNSVPIEELERQIEATRHSLDETLGELQFRFSQRRQAALAMPVVILALGIAGALYLRTTRSRRRLRLRLR
jgi:hypothetical protein